MSTPMASRSETHSKNTRPISFSGMNVSQVKSKLTAQLEDKEKLLEKVGKSQISRNALIKQTDVIRKEIQFLEQYNEREELPTPIRSKLENLANEFQYLKSSKSMLDDNSNNNSHFSPLLPPPPTNSSPTTKRSKAPNGNRRNTDIEFATEIGQGLLIEVRKLQVALQEKEEMIKSLELAKADNERNHETTQRHLKQREEIEERLKEENWNLEVAKQELRTHLLEANQTVAKHSTEYGRLVKQLKSQSEQIDIMKAQEEKSTSVIEAMKARHEQETHQLRKHAANAQRENAVIQKQVEGLNTELKIVKAKLAIKLATSSRVATEENNQLDANLDNQEDNDSENDQNKNPSMSVSTSTPRNQQAAMETETLKQSLAHAHRIISNLRSSYHKEKLEKFEIKKMLSDSQENIEQLRKEMSSLNNGNGLGHGGNHGGRGSSKASKKKAVVAKKKRGGVARQPRGLVANESDSDQQSIQENNSFEEEEEEETTDEYDSMNEDNLLDQHFTSFGNSFSGFNNNNNPFGSIATMKPLSSELEANNKVQVIDAGINTDPIEYIACVHHHQDDSAVISNHHTRSNSLVAPSAPQQENEKNQEVIINNQNGDNQQSQQQTSDIHNDSTKHISTQDISNVSSPVTPTTTTSNPHTLAIVTEKYVEQQVIKALDKERHEIAKRADSVLSPEQIQSIIFVTAPVNHQTNKNIPTVVDSSTQSADNKTEATRNIPSSTTTITAQEEAEAITEKMIPEKEVDQLIQAAVEKETAQMVPKSEMEKLIQDAVVTEQEKTASLNLIPKAKADELVQEAIAVEEEKVVALNLIPKAKADELVQEAIVAEQEKVASLNLIPKTKADEMVAEVLEEVTSKLKVEADVRVQETRVELAAQFKETEKELLQNMILKAEAEALALEAVALASEKIKKEHEEAKMQQEGTTILKNVTPPSTTTEDMMTKKEAEELVKQALANEQVKIQQALEKQKADVETAALASHKKALDAQLEKHKLDMEAIKQAELEKQKLDMEAIKQAELEKHLAELQAVKGSELEKQRAELEAAKQSDLEKQQQEHEQAKQAELEQQKKEIETLKQAELDQQKKEIESIKQAELDQQKREIENLKQAELEEQKAQVETMARAKLEKKMAEIEATKQAELEKQRETANAELAVLTKSIESYKKECEETNNRMKTMLTKDSADVLVKRAVADALEKAERKQAEVLAGMISKEYALVMVRDEVNKALEKERKEVAEREEAEAINMMSKAEAEALAKVAAADAIVKERQAMSAREKELVTKEEAEMLTTTAVREALEKERAEAANVLARERKLLREKEERILAEAEEKKQEAVRLALSEAEKEKEKDNKKIPEITTTLSNNKNERSLETPLPTKFMDNTNENTIASTYQQQQQLPPTAIERSVSTSRLAPPMLSISPSPSVSTPASSPSRKLRLSSSVSSLRLGGSGSGRKENPIQKNQRTSTDSSTSTFGSFRILENTKYASRLQSKSSISLRDLSQKQESVASISTLSSDDRVSHHTVMPMSSEESFAGYSTGDGSTDLAVIQAITQTMIGEWMSKHTRRYVGGGISENKHQRFFWVHPYTKILYWSSSQPGADGIEAKTKSVFIESVSAVPSHDHTGASPMSLLIRTPKRDLKITAPSLERHDMWLKSLSYLLGRPNGTNSQLMEEPRLTMDSVATDYTNLHQPTATISTKASSIRSQSHHAHDIVQYDSDDSEDIPNIRQCCDGKHDVSTLSKGGAHHHHHS